MKTEDLNEDSLAFLLATMMNESEDPGEFRRKFTANIDKAYGSDFADMSKDAIAKAQAIVSVYSKADKIYHKIKN